MFSRRIDSLSYFASSVIYFLTWRRLSYFGCIVNQVFNLTMIWTLLLEVYFNIILDGKSIREWTLLNLS